uniref:Putative secreted protein n=1 Tax=Anopheles darlingi TaxID=43151 RepID=A0A2M4D3C9_ANODA
MLCLRYGLRLSIFCWLGQGQQPPYVSKQPSNERKPTATRRLRATYISNIYMMVYRKWTLVATLNILKHSPKRSILSLFPFRMRWIEIWFLSRMQKRRFFLFFAKDIQQQFSNTCRSGFLQCNLAADGPHSKEARRKKINSCFRIQIIA